MDKLLSLDAYKEYYAIDDIDNFLDVNFKVCRDVMCPANKIADEVGATFVGGNEHAVVTPDEFKTVYKTVQDAELGQQFGFRGDGKIPLVWYSPILEMQSAASAAIVMFWCLTQGATTVLQDYGTPKQQEIYLENMYAGKWCGTMGLTEPGAGSEVGAVQSKAFPTETPHIYKNERPEVLYHLRRPRSGGKYCPPDAGQDPGRPGRHTRHFAVHRAQVLGRP
jgi:Acyl-CoA dehydrogenases